MFKVGQVWRNNQSGWLYQVVSKSKTKCMVLRLTGYSVGLVGSLHRETAKAGFTLIGNNYKPKASPEQRGCRKEDC